MNEKLDEIMKEQGIPETVRNEVILRYETISEKSEIIPWYEPEVPEEGK